MAQSFPLSWEVFAARLPIVTAPFVIETQHQLSGLGTGDVLAAQLAPSRWAAQVTLGSMPVLEARAIQALIESLGQEVYQLDDKLDLIQTELAEITGAEDYDPLATYAEGDIVKYDGKLYRATAATTGNAPTDADFWDKIGDYSSIGEAVVALTGRVEEAESEIETTQAGFRTTARDSRRIYNALMSNAVGELDKAGAAAFEARDRLDAAAVAARWTETEIARVDGVLTVHASDIALVQATLAAKADVSVTQALQATVTDHGDRLDSQGASITSIANALPGKASQTALNELSSTVTAQGGTITSQGSTITALQSALAGYTDANAVASAFTTTNTNVSNINGVLASHATRTDSLFAALGGSTADVRLKYEAVAGPDGYSRLAAIGRTSGFADRAASFGFDVPNNASLPTRTWVQGDQFLILGSDGQLRAMFDAGGATINNARIGGLTAANLAAGSITADRLAVGAIYISSPVQFAPGVIEEGAFSSDALVSSNSTSKTRTGATEWLPDGVGSGWRDWLSLSITSPNLRPVLFFVGYDVYETSPSNVGGSSPGLYIEIRCLLNGNVVTGLYNSGSVSGYSQTVQLTSTFVAMPATGQTSNTITIQGRVRGNSPAWNEDRGGLAHGTITLTAQCSKK